MSTTQELIKRLKAMCGGVMSPLPPAETADVRAAADRLASLSAELDALKAKLAGVDEKALEAAAIALIDHDPSISGHHPIHVDYKRPIARAAIAAYLAALGGGG